MDWRAALKAIKDARASGGIQNLQYPGCPAGNHFRPWDDSWILETMRSGGRVLIWSKVLGEWVFWVRDETESERIAESHPSLVTYTAREIWTMVRERWCERRLRLAHKTKKLLGGRVVQTASSNEGQRRRTHV
jgi:hypothetical protein